MEVSCVLKYGNWGEYPLRYARPPCRGTVIIGGRCTQRPYHVDVNRKHHGASLLPLKSDSMLIPTALEGRFRPNRGACSWLSRSCI